MRKATLENKSIITEILMESIKNDPHIFWLTEVNRQPNKLKVVIEFIIELYNSASGNKFDTTDVKFIRFNSNVIDNYKFSHFDLMNGGTVDFEMTDQIPVN